MLTKTMEVDCSLDEFTKVFAANGYINDDSCFADTDLPSMLSAFETADVLDSPDSFPDSPYSNEELSRVLEMAQIGSPSILDSCLGDTLTRPRVLHPVSTSPDSSLCKTRDPLIANVVLSESLHNLSEVLSERGVSTHKDTGIGNNMNNGVVSLNLDLLDAKENDILNKDTFNSESSVPQISDISPFLEHSSDYYKFHPHQNIPSAHTPLPDLQHQVPLHLASSNESVSTSDIPNNADPVKKQTSQKRKRKNKGYSKPPKSRKTKTNATRDTESKPKPKKPKATKATVKKGSSSFDDNLDTPQEDSGFESGDRATLSGSESNLETATSSTIDKNLNSPSEEEPKALRRSSRTTRNTENYNFRLSSLVKRVETERRQQEPRQPKGKAKPPPLSKYRRRTANARERDRMKEINDAFDNLKDSLPHVDKDEGKNKATKFTILKHALNYIASLRDMLGYEAIPSSLDDDASSDMSSVRPASVTSSVGEDSCSSPTSGHSETDHRNNINNSSCSFISKQAQNPYCSTESSVTVESMCPDV